MNNSIVAGVDIGGSHITVALVNLEAKTILTGTRVRQRVNSGGPADEIIRVWAEAIEKTLRPHGDHALKLSIAMPGPFDYDKGISLIKDQDKYDALYNLNVRSLLSARLGIPASDIRFINDAECFLCGEVFCGAAQGSERAIGVTLGTGLGTATFKNNNPEDADLWSLPFKDGIAEDYLSTRWCVKRYQELSGQNIQDVKALAALIAEDRDTGKVKQVFNEFGNSLGSFLAAFIQKEAPEVVVLGGNISKVSSLFFPALEQRLNELSIQIPVENTELGENAALIGAASYWDLNFFKRNFQNE